MIVLGLDVGQNHDPAALAVLHSRGSRPGSHRPAWTVLDIGNIPRHTPYREVAHTAADLAGEFAAGGFDTALAIDATGIGGAVVELARQRAPQRQVYAVTIGAGRTLRHNGPGEFTVGKHRLTEALQVALEQGGITVDEHAARDGITEFHNQLRQFVVKSRADKPAYQRHEAASGHDDLVLAAELALWTGDARADEQAGVPLVS